MTELLSDIDTPSDAELISRVRGGDVAAYGELFSRHVQAANRLAKQLVRGPDADDLVSDAFAKVLSVLQAGGGPDVAFRAYLLTAVRRLHVDRVRAGSRLQTSDDMTQFDPGIPFQDTAVSGFESGAAARAFASLPERWQLVLWHLEVEGQKPADIAPLLGMSANSVSALAYRAREGLRQAFLTMHLSDISEDSCRWVNEHLGAYVRHGLAKRDAAKVDDHLQECRRCTAMYLELTEVNSDLKAIIAPLLLGAAATGYLASSGSAGTAGVLALVGRVRDVIMANAGVAGAGAAAAGVAAVATTAVLLAQGHHDTVIGADRPIAATTRIAPSAAAAPAPGGTGSAAPSPRPSSVGTPPGGTFAGLLPGTVTSTAPGTLPTSGSTPATVLGTGPGALSSAGPGAGPGTGPGAGTSPGAPPTSPAGQPSSPPPSHSPTGPAQQPTPPPTHQPTGGPTNQPTGGPTNQPTGGPTHQPTGGPSSPPTDEPSTTPTTPSGGGQTDQPTPTPPTTPPGGSGGSGGTVSPVFAPLVLASSAPDQWGRFPVQVALTGLPEDLPSLTFTVSPVSSQIGVSQFTSPTTVSFADRAPASPDGRVAATGGTCSLDGPGALTCTDITGDTLSASFPVTVSPLAQTTVKITATGSGVNVTSDPLTIAPPTADIALSDVTVTQDNGNYSIHGDIAGVPTDYPYDPPAVSVTSDDAVDLTTVSNQITPPDSTGERSFTVVVAADDIQKDTHVTVSVGSLPGYIDGSGDLANNSWPVVLEPPSPPAKGLVLEITDLKPASGTNWQVTVSVTGAEGGALKFGLESSGGGTVGSGGSDNNAVTFEPQSPQGCDTIAKSSQVATCSADQSGNLTTTFTVKIPAGQTGMLTVSDGTQPIQTQPLLDADTH